MITWSVKDVEEGPTGSGIGGDDTEGHYWSVLYVPEPVRIGGTFPRIEESFYIRRSLLKYPYTVESQISYGIFADPDYETELWDDMDYDGDISPYGYATLKDAERIAAHTAKSQTGAAYLWDGMTRKVR